MVDSDDFEIINDLTLSSEQTFELIDADDIVDRVTSSARATAPVIATPPRLPEPVLDELSPIVPLSVPSPAIMPSVEQERQTSPETSIPLIALMPAKRLAPTPIPPKTYAPVPPLPKAPAPQRYGDAALIPHHLQPTCDMDAIINKSQRHQQTTLSVSTQQQQQRDIQTVLEQRRQVLNKK